ncbi:glycosyltransferase family 4 protein [Pseudonocardia sp. Cha107L01]|uniref:glycosyltransferase family 4 protein n=1 Tax=Pseudonocardia sp. Cha107L01 TaxID=3457576 RepID=UPI00403E406B
MKITEVLPRPAIGGAETMVEQLSSHWRAEGHTVNTVYLDPEGNPTGRFRRVVDLSRALSEVDPDVVHAHSALPNCYARLASRGRWPVITVLHSAGRDLDIRSLRIAERLLSRWTSHIIAVSPGQIDEYRHVIGNRVGMSLIPNGVRSDIQLRTHASMRLGRVVAVSRLDPQKRMDVLFAGWRRAGLDAELRVAGQASDCRTQRRVERWAAHTPNLELLGRVDAIPALLAHSDLLVHTADREAHGSLVAIEAACAGLPVIVSGAVAADLPDDLSMLTFRTGDPDSLAATLRAAAGSFSELSSAAIERAPSLAREFSLSVCADRHLAAMRACQADHPRSGTSV